MRYMKGFCAMLFAAGLMFSAGSLFAEVEDGSHIKITSPKDGAKVGRDLRADLRTHEGAKAAHGHVYLDGEPQKKFPAHSKVSAKASIRSQFKPRLTITSIWPQPILLRWRCSKSQIAGKGNQRLHRPTRLSNVRSQHASASPASRWSMGITLITDL